MEKKKWKMCLSSFCSLVLFMAIRGKGCCSENVPNGVSILKWSWKNSAIPSSFPTAVMN